MPADALWTFCMALTVYITFSSRQINIQIRNLEKVYLVFCYGLPSIPAFVYLMEDAAARKTIYGNATVSNSECNELQQLT